MAKHKDLKDLAIRLRVEERKPLSEIAEVVQISKSTASLWLRDYPLTDAEMKAKNNDHPHNKKARGEASKLYQLFGANAFTRQQKGKIAEAAILLRLVASGFEVFGSPFDGDKADWLIRKNGKTLTVQVKWARFSGKGLPYLRICCTEGHNKTTKYKEGDFDVLIGYDFYTDTAYVYRWHDIANKECVSVSEEFAEKFEKLQV